MTTEGPRVHAGHAEDPRVPASGLESDPIADAIRQALAALAPSRLILRNDSALHAGHAGAQSGGGHYHIEIESADFTGQSRLLRHRQIYAALGSLMDGAIHALAIEALAPGESRNLRR